VLQSLLDATVFSNSYLQLLLLLLPTVLHVELATHVRHLENVSACTSTSITGALCGIAIQGGSAAAFPAAASYASPYTDYCS